MRAESRALYLAALGRVCHLASRHDDITSVSVDATDDRVSIVLRNEADLTNMRGCRMILLPAHYHQLGAKWLDHEIADCLNRMRNGPGLEEL